MNYVTQTESFDCGVVAIQNLFIATNTKYNKNISKQLDYLATIGTLECKLVDFLYKNFRVSSCGTYSPSDRYTTMPSKKYYKRFLKYTNSKKHVVFVISYDYSIAHAFIINNNQIINLSETKELITKEKSKIHEYYRDQIRYWVIKK